MRKGQQIPLNIQLNDEATFSNFFVSETSGNAQVFDAVQRLCCSAENQAVEHFVYLWGAPGAGISHLLQAACHASQLLEGRQSQYLPLVDLAGFDPAELLDGLESLDLICLDELQYVVGRVDWDNALFGFYNRARESGCRLLVSANCPPKELKSTLPDLASRLVWGLTYRLEAMDDRAKQQALQKRAALRGLEMNDEVARFILNRGSREPRELFACLDRLDKKSLAENRKLSIPLVKEVLGL